MRNTELKDCVLESGKAVGPQVYDIIRKQIIQGGLAPGIRISEAEISRSLQTSRQPVREAFISLRNEGLVEVAPQRGTYVSLISIQAVSDARFIREAVEADIVALLVKNNSPEMIEKLRCIISEQRTLGEDHLQEFMELDESFHRTLANMAGKNNIWQIIATTKAHFDRVRFMASLQKPIQPLVNQHEAVVDAIEQGNREYARTAIRSHLQEVLRDLPTLVSRQPDIFID